MDYEKTFNFGKVYYGGSSQNTADLTVSLKQSPAGYILQYNARIYKKGDIILEGLEILQECIMKRPFYKMYHFLLVYSDNHLKYGTPAQEQAIAQYLRSRRVGLLDGSDLLRKIGLLYDFNIEGLHCEGGFHPDVISGKRGYKYAEGYIFQEIPQQSLDKIIELLK